MKIYSKNNYEEKKLVLYGISLVVLAVIGLIPFRPFITIHNDTGEQLYILASESKHGVEPEPEEVEKLMRRKPDIIEPGGVLRLTPSFGSLIKDGFDFNIGWLIGGKHSYKATGSGGQNFLFSSTTGTCSASLIIQAGHNNYLLRNEEGGFCLKKLSPFKYKY